MDNVIGVNQVPINSTLNKINELMQPHEQRGGFQEDHSVEWFTDLPSNVRLEQYYSTKGPTVGTCLEVGSSVLYFIAFSNLAEAQMGYRTLENGQPCNGWDQGCVVIALFDDEPVMVNTTSAQAAVWAAYESGNPKLIADNLEDFFQSIHTVIDIQYKKYNFEVLNEDTLEYKEEYLADLNQKLRELLPEDQLCAFMDFFFG
ncbi:hypothetical protein VNTUMSATTG_39200 [Vibrio nigripulchritudo]|nr:hypothetical protein VNTUMSATTG_39200 [Vibrio nigripulchritudo]